MPSRIASTSAFAAAVCFVLGMALLISQQPPMTFVGPPSTVVVVMSLAFILWHLLLLPVVAVVDAAPWAKGSGYAWIAIDNVIVFMSFFGVGAELVMPMRLGVHLAAATWVFGASVASTGAERIAGLLATIALLAASFAGPFVGAQKAGQMLGPSALLLVIWVGLIGLRLRRA